MLNIKPQVQAVRPISKDNLDSSTLTPAPTVHFDCHSNPATGESFVLWDDIRLVFADALYVRHETKVVPFMKDAEWMPLKPLRFAAVPDAVLDIVVDNPLVRLEAAIQQTTITDTPKEAKVQDTFQEDTTLKLASSPTSNAPRRNPVYGLVETAMENYSHIDHPDFRPKPRGPQYVPTINQEEGSSESTDNAPKNDCERKNINAQANNGNPLSTSQSHQSPQDHTAPTSARNISPIVVKASLGDAKSQVELGDMYRTGDGVEEDFDEARYWYFKAANQGYPAGQCNVGHLYRLELGVDRNHSTAMSWYKKAADQGDAEGQCHVGIMHDYGLVGALDYSAAMDWYMMAANQGYAYAQYCIGNLYGRGRGVQQDYDKAMEWYLRAADQGLPAAQFWIGYMYLEGTGVSQDKTIALEWLSKAASRKDVDFWSQMALGQMYNNGLSVPQSDITAFTWFLKASRQGSPAVQHFVGFMYRYGEGIPQDLSKALFYLTKSADHNQAHAQYEIGTMYLHGQGVPKNYLTAKGWFVKAVNSSPIAINNHQHPFAIQRQNRATSTVMLNIKPQIQAVRPVSKDNLDSPTTTPAPTVYFDCHSNPATGKGFVLWDDIRLVFADALYVRHNAKVVPFMKDADWMPLKPLRIAAVPDAVFDIVVDNPLVRLEAAVQQTTIADIPREVTGQDTLQEDTTLSLTNSPASNAPRRNPVYGLVETAMENYSHIDHPDFRPKPRAPQFVPTADQEEGANMSTDIAPKNDSEPKNISVQANNDKPISTSQSHQSPQDHTATTAIRDISPIVVKASLGDPISQVELGDMYRTGDGVEQDLEAARYWYLKAANQGDPAGQCNLGHLYRLELGVDRNHSTALSWYKKAADQGDAEGQCYVGYVHFFGLVGALDYREAMEWYMLAANQGHAYAQCCIGDLYAGGQGVQQDYDKAMEWYLRAADQGLPVAQIQIGSMYVSGLGVAENQTIALDWFSKAITRKDVDVWSQMAMGVMYYRGLGVPKSDSTSFRWFLKAAHQGSPHAQRRVGSMYHVGAGVPQDFSKALFWFLKAANHNFSDVQHEIGSMYFQGQGVPQDYSKAQEWYTKAANLGHEGAKVKIYAVQVLSLASRLKFW
ncbi:hypothetical protein F5H01DRAFT_393690 [Linnemannia elongata]|nr:hypothetical protein F5H01DRAFT_393690 [Linnemannia elongata]